VDQHRRQAVVARLSIDGAEFWIQADAASSPQALNGRSVRMILGVAGPDSVFARVMGAAMAMSIK